MAYQGRRVRVADRWWPLRVPAVVAGLLLVDWLLMDEVGTPATLLRELGDIGEARTSPVGSMLALMALLVETIAGYALAVLVLRSLCACCLGPRAGSAGRLASVVTPVGVRRLLDLLGGGALFAQATLAATPGAPPHRWSALQLILPLRSLPTPALLAVDRGMFSWFFFVLLPRLRTSRERVSGRTRVDGTSWCRLSGCGEAFGVVPD